MKIVVNRTGGTVLEYLQKNAYPVNCACGGNARCGKCRVSFICSAPEPTPAERALLTEEELSRGVRLACETLAVEGTELEIASETGLHICSAEKVTGKLTSGEGTLALDIGTTTLALAAADLQTGEIAAAVTAENPQRSFGADVMSRIACCASGMTAQLQHCLLGTLHEMFNELSHRLGSVAYSRIIVSANTTMTNIFFGEDCTSMGTAPYTPPFLASRTQTGILPFLPECEVVSVPCVSEFVGGDIVSGLLETTRGDFSRPVMLLDLGTNAELALCAEGRCLVTACAAGPAFEGGNISCGMSASDGAIYRVETDGTRLSVHSYGEGMPRGVCGTGLIDAVACMLKTGVLDETGYLEGGELRLAPGVALTQKDVREFQLAKSAVKSGIDIICSMGGIEPADVERVYIAGGFASRVGIEQAVSCGILPEKFKEKCVPVGNSSLAGAVRLGTLENMSAAEKVAGSCRYVSLSEQPEFAGLFAENMLFNCRPEGR